MKYDYTVFIGRFQIPHHGHFHVITEALKVSQNVIIGIGSSNLGRSLRNPFSYEQRASMISNCDVPEIMEAIQNGRIIFTPLEDSIYSDTWWVEQVQRKVNSAIDRRNFLNAGVHRDHAKIALIGCTKDETSYYLSMFSQWKFIEVQQEKIYAATECRNAYYEFGPEAKTFANKLPRYTTQGVINILKTLPDFVHKDLQKKFFDVRDYQKEWGIGPFDATDIVVVKNGHVLCIKRGGEPYNADKWALPGGFIEQGEEPYSAALRELKEETGLTMGWQDKQSLRPELHSQAIFDKPDRDDRAHIISHAFCFKLLDGGPLPVVKGQDDAEHAEWVALADLRADNMFNDHYFIVRKLIAGL